MSVQRHYFCLWFEQGPREDGSFGCGHTGPQCPFGWHRCGRCGSFDHGARGSQCVAPPIPVHIELPTFDLALPSTCPPASSSSAVGVEGFGFKGEGKHANLGVEVPDLRWSDMKISLQIFKQRRAITLDPLTFKRVHGFHPPFRHPLQPSLRKSRDIFLPTTVESQTSACRNLPMWENQSCGEV